MSTEMKFDCTWGNFRGALAILASAGVAGAVSGQTLDRYQDLGEPEGIDPCKQCVSWQGSMVGFEMRHTVVVVDGSVTQTCANVGGIAWTWNRTEGPWFCEPVPEPQPGDESVALSFIQCSVGEEVAEAFYNITFHVPSIPATPEPCSPCDDDRIWEGGAYVLGAIPSVGQGAIGLGTTTNKIAAVQGQEDSAVPDCEGTWIYDRSESGLGVVGGAFSHDVSGGASLAVGLLVSIAYTRDTDDYEIGSNWGRPFVPSALCDQPRACGVDYTSGAPVAHILTTSAHVVGGASIGSVTGGYVQFADGSFVKLGAFDTTAFDPTANDNFDLTIPTSAVGASPATIDVAMDAETFPLIFGDVDGDGEVCGGDRSAFMLAFNTVIGDANYNLRADLDLDGDVDTNDLDDLNLIGCTADLDCDGANTVFDQTAFAAAFSASDPLADFDGDGSFTLFDYVEFGNVFDIGCP